MSAVDPGFAVWLRSAALFAENTNATIATNWGDRSIISETLSSLALVSGANTEAARQEALMGGPLVIDELNVKGLRSDLIGQCVTLTSDRFGYDGAGQPGFVIGVAEQQSADRTILTVLRKL